MKLPEKVFSKELKTVAGIFIAIVAVCVFIFIVLAQWASRGAAIIFNREMEKQDMLRGTITVDSIMANIAGNVTFENLVWREPDGDLILQVPEGSFHVRPWDVVTRNIKSTTVQKIALKNAVISVRFDEDMQVDFLPQKKPGPKRPKGEKRETFPWEADTPPDNDDEANFNRNGRKLRGEIILEDCRLEARYRKRHYILHNVNMNLALNTSGKSHIDFSTGKFGGTMLGGGMSIFGDIDFKPETPLADVDVSIRDVDPSSLGFGMNIHDLMTVVARISGPITGPQGRGTVKMKELNIPALDFKDVIGDVYYSDSLFRFADVHAKVYGGDLAARGDYHLDTRKYHIFGNGKNLDSKRALRDLKMSCLVDLNINLECNGNPRDILAYGDFKSGKGHYSIIPFNSLQGRFTNRFKELFIYDAVIDTPVGVVSTPEFSIIRGKLHLGRIILTDQDTGEVITIREEKDNDNSNDKSQEGQDKKDKIKNRDKRKKGN